MSIYQPADPAIKIPFKEEDIVNANKAMPAPLYTPGQSYNYNLASKPVIPKQVGTGINRRWNEAAPKTYPLPARPSEQPSATASIPPAGPTGTTATPLNISTLNRFGTAKYTGPEYSVSKDAEGVVHGNSMIGNPLQYVTPQIDLGKVPPSALGIGKDISGNYRTSQNDWSKDSANMAITNFKSTYADQVASANKANQAEADRIANRSIGQRLADMDYSHGTRNLSQKDKLALATGEFDARQKQVQEETKVLPHNIAGQAALQKQGMDAEYTKAQIARLQQQGKYDEAKALMALTKLKQGGGNSEAVTDYYDPQRHTNVRAMINKGYERLPLLKEDSSEYKDLKNQLKALEKHEYSMLNKEGKPINRKGALPTSQSTENGDIS